ncbi:MAG TPA: hypothetical protein VD770_01805 [Coxiellaceae bacterium]|nr:hypothetical protein [Coxiellaceae bacterium]
MRAQRSNLCISSCIWLFLILGAAFHLYASRRKRAGINLGDETVLDIITDTAVDTINLTPTTHIAFSMGGAGAGYFSFAIDEALLPGIKAAIEANRCGTQLSAGFDNNNTAVVSLDRFLWAPGSAYYFRGHHRIFLEAYDVDPDERALACLQVLAEHHYPVRYLIADFLRLGVAFMPFTGMAMMFLNLVGTHDRLAQNFEFAIRAVMQHVELGKDSRHRLFEPLFKPSEQKTENQYKLLYTEAKALGFNDLLRKLENFHEQYRCPISLALMDDPVSLGGKFMDFHSATTYLNNDEISRHALQDETYLLAEYDSWPLAHPLPVNREIKEAITKGLARFEMELEDFKACTPQFAS